jgi:prepilin-type processing-associated H-X9-DG protein
MNRNRPSDLEPSSTRRHRPGDDCRAFTLVELLVVVATVGILTLLLLPALAGTQPGSTKAFQCLNNMRQLAVGWTLYAEDNHDRLVVNSDAYRAPAINWCQGIEDWTTAKVNTNINNLIQDNAALLAPYSGHRYQIYHCPADVYVSPAQAAVGWQNRIRSVSMSAALGGGSRAPQFTWNLKIQKIKMTDLRNPGPGSDYVFLDEAPDSINDAMFYNNPDATGALTGTANGGNWIDWPASWHDGGGTFSFADGHAELHKWADANTRRTTPPSFTSGVSGNKGAPDDVAWMSAHTPLP